ncbi:hypothetical protein DPMN_019054 [Dreissena polymorpha]|uniref:Uncharacterized protein n=1 Tax=Dreissena polymorpha TaxID=45954 RepID=A0A9D4NJM6_DREPO|nr:hypothetical protein DPMN_019054 [Dreissena polymorpha]
MELLVHNLLSLANAVAVLIRISAAMVHPWTGLRPSILKLFTSYSFLLFMLMSAMVLVDLHPIYSCCFIVCWCDLEVHCWCHP